MNGERIASRPSSHGQPSWSFGAWWRDLTAATRSAFGLVRVAPLGVPSEGGPPARRRRDRVFTSGGKTRQARARVARCRSKRRGGGFATATVENPPRGRSRGRFVRRASEWPGGGGHTGVSRSSLPRKQAAARRVKRAHPKRADHPPPGALDATAAVCSQLRPYHTAPAIRVDDSDRVERRHTRAPPRGTKNVLPRARTWQRRVAALMHATRVPPATRATATSVRKQGPAGIVNRDDHPTNRQDGVDHPTTPPRPRSCPRRPPGGPRKTDRPSKTPRRSPAPPRATRPPRRTPPDQHPARPARTARPARGLEPAPTPRARRRARRCHPRPGPSPRRRRTERSPGPTR